jgi:group I intron endonuclease
MKSGVYKILNKINGKFYIGSAKNVTSRWDQHRRSLLKGKHSNPMLQRAVKKYGFNSFIFEVLEQCTLFNLQTREQYYLDTLKPFEPKGYNIALNALHPMEGRKHREETKQKMRNAKPKIFYRCIDLSKMKVVYLTQQQLLKEKGIKDFHKFVNTPGHWTKKQLVSFVNKPLEGKTYTDKQAEVFLQDVKEIKHNNISNAQKGKVGTFTNKKHTEESRQKMRRAWQLRRIMLSESERTLPSDLDPL